MVVGLSCLALEFVSVGGLPVFMENTEIARFNLQVNGYVHLLGINVGVVGSLFIFLSFYRNNKVIVSFDRYFISGVICILAVFLTGNRLDIFMPLVILIALCISFGWLKLSFKLVFYFAVLLISLGLIKHFREIAQGGSEYVSMVAGQIDYDISPFLLMLYPLYMTFAYNFVVLDRLVSLGPIVHTGGLYTIYPFYSLLPGQQLSFGEYSNWLIGVKYYSVLTSTYLSNLYVDFGRIGALIGSVCLGALFTFIYLSSKRSIAYTIVYAVMLPRLMLSFYVFPFEQFSSIFHVIFAVMFYMVFQGGARGNRELNS
jgi:oligosaccharide repeat unit polymerase